MKKRRLGSNGEAVSVVGFGAWPIGGGMGAVEEKQAVRTVHAALDHGITLIDTAEAYRHSESFLGAALTDGRRNRVFLATKASFDFSPAGIRAALESSLRNLRTDRLDLYQLHRWDPSRSVEESMGELARLKEEGKVRFIGISNFTVDQTRRAAKTTRVDSTQPAYNMFDRDIESDLIPYCAAQGIGILAHSVFAKGLLTGKYRPDHTFALDDERSSMPRFQGRRFREYLERAGRLKTVAQGLGVTLVQLALAWVLRDPTVTCALAGAKSPEQVAEQAKAAELRLDDPTINLIESILA